jgi:prepilin-type N-terminal cleavage/methylation domain-containing protein/prepilin-type processing-associated H-X9-DG protein
MKSRRKSSGFTLIETLIAISIIAAISMIGFQGFKDLRMRANQAASTTNLRQLAAANLLYTADHLSYCPFGDSLNRTRWHGGRDSAAGSFDPEKGYLAEYLGQSRRVGTCPQLAPMLTDAKSWEDGSGGYGYNDTYIGAMPGASFQPNRPANVPRPDRTLMFATTAFAKGSGLQEYPSAAAWRSVNQRGTLGGSLQPSVHFRFNGRALVAWCDGHITEEQPSQTTSTNFYGGDNETARIGFCGPEENNGWWNPGN